MRRFLDCPGVALPLPLSRFMNKTPVLTGGGVLACFLIILCCSAVTLSAAMIEFAPGVGADADQPVIQEVVAAFHRADEAVRKADIDTLMKFYATTYNYHGLTRADVRRVWLEVFDHYRDISSSHVFTELKLTRANGVSKADVTCTGWLMGTDKGTGKPVTIDSWVREVHYLVKEDGAWRFLGNKGGPAPAMPPASAPHHPLF